jgi:hypothetical protein
MSELEENAKNMHSNTTRPGAVSPRADVSIGPPMLDGLSMGVKARPTTHEQSGFGRKPDRVAVKK